MDKLKFFVIAVPVVIGIIILLVYVLDAIFLPVIGSIFVAVLVPFFYGLWDRRRQKNNARESIFSSLCIIKKDIDEEDKRYQHVYYTYNDNSKNNVFLNTDGEPRSRVTKIIRSSYEFESFKIDDFGKEPNNNSVRLIDVKIRNKISEKSNGNKEIKYTAVHFSTAVFDSIFSSGQFLLFDSDYQLKIKSLYDLLKKHNECLLYILKLEDTLVTNKTLDDYFESLIIPYEIELTRCETYLCEIIQNTPKIEDF